MNYRLIVNKIEDYTLSIILPAYNEENKLEKCIEETIERMKTINNNYEIIIVENGSIDSTLEIANQITKKYSFIRAIHIDTPCLAGAIKKGSLLAKGNVIVNLDVDLATDMTHLKQLIDYSKDYDIVTGSRYIDETLVKRNLSRYIPSKILNYFIIRGMLHSKIKDNNCGFRAMKRKIALILFNEIQDEGLFGLIELLVIAQRKGFTIKEFPVRWRENPRRLTTKDILNYFIPALKLWIRLL